MLCIGGYAAEGDEGVGGYKSSGTARGLVVVLVCPKCHRFLKINDISDKPQFKGILGFTSTVVAVPRGGGLG